MRPGKTSTLESALAYWVPESLRDDSPRAQRARTTAHGLILLAGLNALLGLLSFYQGEWALTWVRWTAGLCGVGLLFLHRHPRGSLAAAWLGMAVFYVDIVVMAFLLGGFDSSLLGILTIVPLAGTIATGVRGGIVWAVATALPLFASEILASVGWGSPDVWRFESRAGTLAAVWGSLSLVIVYERMLRGVRERVRERDVQLRTVYDVVPDVIFMMTKEGVFTDYYAASDAELYMLPEDFLGKRYADVMPPSVVETTTHAIAKLETESQVSFEYELPIKDETRHFEARLAALGADQILSIVRDITVRKRAEALRDKFFDRVLEAQDDERRRLARELHDESAQRMAGIVVGLASLEGKVEGSLRTEVSTLGEEARHTTEELGRLARGLHPSLLDELGLEAALQKQLEEVERRHGIAVDYRFEGSMDQNRLVATALYRITQEALNNIVKHAQANRARVTVEQLETRVTLVVEDDGVGLREPRDEAHGLGLVGIAERVRLLGGEVSVESGEQGGTRLEVMLRNGGAPSPKPHSIGVD